MERYWFKRKKYGYGWTPATKEGWFLIIAYVGIVILDAYRINQFALSDSEFLVNFIPDIFFLTLIMLVISIATGEKPKWQWGSKKDN